MNYMGAPNENGSPISLFPNDSYQSKRSSISSFLPSSPNSTLPAEKQLLNGSWHNPRNSKPFKDIFP